MRDIRNNAKRPRRARRAAQRAAWRAPTLAAFAALGAFALVGSMMAGVAEPTLAGADTLPPPGVPATVSVDPLPTVQINGVVMKQVTVGDDVYAVGSFTSVRPAGDPPGTGEQPQEGLVVYSLSTGQLVAGYQHTLNAQGMAVAASPDGSKVYIGGDFTTVDGQPRGHVAEIDTATGALDPTFHPWVDSRVQAMTATNSEVFVGGQFTQVNGVARTNLAALTPTGGLVNWAPTADNGIVTAMVMTPDQSRVIVGGRFTTLNGQPANATGSLNATTGAQMPWALNQTVADSGSGAAPTSLATDGTNIFGGGYVYENPSTPLTLEGTWSANPMTGAVNWIDDCQGDTYGVYPLGQVLYSVSHAHDCAAIGGFPGVPTRRALAETPYATGVDGPPEPGYTSFQGEPDSTLLHWYPDLSVGNYDGADQAAYSVTGNSSYIALGGEFVASFGKPQQGLVRYAVTSLAPNKIGPYPNPAMTPTATLNGGVVNLSWQGTWDPDNATLTYTAYRNGTAIGTVQASSDYWDEPTLTFADTSAPAGPHTYTVRAADPFGDGTLSGASNSVTAPGEPASQPHMLQQQTSGLCLDAATPASGQAVSVSSCEGGSAGGVQLWTWWQDGTLRDNGLCLDSNGTGTGSAVVVNACTPTRGQQWTMSSKGQVTQAASALCLDTPTTKPTSGTATVLTPCATATSWVQPQTTSTISPTKTGLCLDGQSHVPGAVVVTNPCVSLTTDSDGSQLWTHWWSGTLQVGSGCLAPATNSAGAPVDLSACATGTNEQWTLTSAGQWQQRASGLCLSAASSPPTSGTTMVLAACSSGTTWQSPTTTKSYVDPTAGLCLDGQGLQPGEYANVWTCHGTVADGNQIWSAYPDGSLHVGSECLDAPGGQPQLAGCDGQPAQVWTLLSSGQLEEPSSGKCLSSPSAAPSPATSVDLAACSSAPTWVKV